MAVPMTFGQFNWRKYKKGVLEELFANSVKSIDSKIPLLFDVRSSDDAYEDLQSWAGIDRFNEWPEGESLTYQTIVERFTKTFTHVYYATGIRYTHKLKSNLKYPLMEEAAAQFGLQAARTKEVLAASFFNNAFTEGAACDWYAVEGKAFFSATHGLANGSTCSNLQTGALTLATYKDACELMWLMTDDNGVKMNLTPELLLVHPSLYFDACEIVKSTDRPDTANRAINVAKTEAPVQVVKWPFLSSSTAWFLKAREYSKVIWYNREDLEQAMDDDFDTRDTKHRASFACSFGAADWRGWVGSTGT